MKYTTIIGTLLIALGITAYFFGNSEIDELFGTKEFLIGLLFGGGIGLLLGGFLGWLYKKPYGDKLKSKKLEDSANRDV